MCSCSYGNSAKILILERLFQSLNVTLWCLDTSCEYRTLSHLFGVGRSTICEIVQETCEAIVNVLMGIYITFPCGDSYKSVISGFE